MSRWSALSAGGFPSTATCAEITCKMQTEDVGEWCVRPFDWWSWKESVFGVIVPPLKDMDETCYQVDQSQLVLSVVEFSHIYIHMHQEPSFTECSQGNQTTHRGFRLDPVGSTYVVCSVQLLLKRSLSHSTINCNVPETCCNVGFWERLVFNHPLPKHFLQGVRCQHPVISGVAGGSWHPFKRAVKAVGQDLFLFFFLAFINSFKVTADTFKYLSGLATYSLLHKYFLTERRGGTLVNFPFLFINELYSRSRPNCTNSLAK